MIFKAVDSNDLDLIKTTVEKDATCLNDRDQGGATPLHRAMFLGNFEAAKLLINAGAEINAIDREFGATPAGWAIEFLRQRDGLLTIEIDDAAEAISRGDVYWVNRFVERFPALRDAKNSDGVSLRELVKESGIEEITKLFESE